MWSAVLGGVRRARKSLRKQGVKVTIAKLFVIAADYLFDVRYGTDTCTWLPLDALTVQGENKGHGRGYQPSRVLPLRRLLDAIKPLTPADSAFVDFGCGKGRVLLIASEFGIKKVRGVEFADELCEIARKNCATFKAKKGLDVDFRIEEGDASEYCVNVDENVFFIFNSFDGIVLNKVLDRIAASLREKRRRVLVLYSNPLHSDIIDQRNDFVQQYLYDFWGHTYKVFVNVG